MSWPSRGKRQMPIEGVTCICSRPIITVRPSSACSRRTSWRVRRSMSPSRFDTSTRNSSPPSRATRSSVSSVAYRRCAISTSSRSPMSWPSESLTALKRSRSMKISAASPPLACRPSRRCWKSRETKLRLGRPVRVSRIASQCARASACLSSVMSISLTRKTWRPSTGSRHSRTEMSCQRGPRLVLTCVVARAWPLRCSCSTIWRSSRRSSTRLRAPASG